MAIYLLKKSYQLKDLQEVSFRDLWGDNGIFTTMWIFGKSPKILFSEGASIIEQSKIYHGFQSEVLVNKSSKLFNTGRKFKVGRYHSLKLKEPFIAENFDITMRCVISGAAMSFENNIDKIYGFQFHPESFLTLNGKILIKKILSA